MMTKNSLKALLLPLTALALTALATSSMATAVDYEHLPVNDLQAELVHNGWASAAATQMVTSLNNEARRVNMPVDLLFGALDQESKFNNYGVNYDFGNYSCGIAQSNVSVWCAVANASDQSRRQYSWPAGAECDDLQDNNAAIMAPMLNAVKAHKTLGVQGAFAADFQQLDPQTLISQMPGADSNQKSMYFQVAMSFVNNCSKSEEGLKIAATQMRLIYDSYIPAQVKAAYPHTAWVLADAIYNIGPVLVDMLQQNGGPQVWQNLTPQTIIDIESSVLRAKPDGSSTIAVTTEDGVMNVGYFQICVNQRHIQNVMRDTLPATMKNVINASTQVCKP